MKRRTRAWCTVKFSSQGSHSLPEVPLFSNICVSLIWRFHVVVGFDTTGGWWGQSETLEIGVCIVTDVHRHLEFVHDQGGRHDPQWPPRVRSKGITLRVPRLNCGDVSVTDILQIFFSKEGDEGDPEEPSMYVAPMVFVWLVFVFVFLDLIDIIKVCCDWNLVSKYLSLFSLPKRIVISTVKRFFRIVKICTYMGHCLVVWCVLFFIVSTFLFICIGVYQPVQS